MTKKTTKKSKVEFCWHCGKKFRGDTSTVLKVLDYDRTLHKQCAKEIEENGVDNYYDDVDDSDWGHGDDYDGLTYWS